MAMKTPIRPQSADDASELMRDILDLINGHEMIVVRAALALAFGTTLVKSPPAGRTRAIEDFVNDATRFADYQEN